MQDAKQSSSNLIITLEKFNGNSTVSDKLEDGWHILTPHDVVILTENVNIKHY